MSNQAYPLDECVYEDDDDYDDDDVALLGSNVGIKKEFSMNQKRCLQEQAPSSSLFITACFTCLAVCGMTIVIPTSQQYTESFNATAKTAGLVVGASPFFLCVAQIPVSYQTRPLSLHSAFPLSFFFAWPFPLPFPSLSIVVCIDLIGKYVAYGIFFLPTGRHASTK